MMFEGVTIEVFCALVCGVETSLRITLLEAEYVRHPAATTAETATKVFFRELEFGN